jgi:hypothetical protein
MQLAIYFSIIIKYLVGVIQDRIDNTHLPVNPGVSICSNEKSKNVTGGETFGFRRMVLWNYLPACILNVRAGARTHQGRPEDNCEIRSIHSVRNGIFLYAIQMESESS